MHLAWRTPVAQIRQIAERAFFNSRVEGSDLALSWVDCLMEDVCCYFRVDDVVRDFSMLNDALVLYPSGVRDDRRRQLSFRETRVNTDPRLPVRSLGITLPLGHPKRFRWEFRPKELPCRHE